MNLKDLIANTTKILGKFPNTYTYTKNLGERLLTGRKGDLPFCLVRPAIINTSYAEPFPGWIDSLAAAAALFLFIGLGIIRYAKIDGNKIGDIIPVDIVSSAIIVSTAYNMRQKNMPIVHVGTSDLNPMTWYGMREDITSYWNSTVSASKMGKSDIFISGREKDLYVHKLKTKIPMQLYRRISPLLGEQHEKNATKMFKTFQRGEELSKLFDFFVSN